MKKQLRRACSIKKQKKHGLINAYILANTYSRNLSQIISDAEKLKDIVSVALVTGEHDIIVKTRVKNLEQLMNVSERVKCIEGVKEASVHIVEKEVFK